MAAGCNSLVMAQTKPHAIKTPDRPVLLTSETHTQLKAYCDANGMKMGYAASVLLAEALKASRKRKGGA